MPRIYTVEFENDAATTADDLLELDAATDHPIEVIGWVIGQTTEIKEAEEEMIRYSWIRGHTTSGSGGASVTPRPVDDGDAAASFAAEAGNTTIASAGTGVDLHSNGFNVRVGEPVWLPEGCGYWTRGTALLVMRLLAAPADSIGFSATVWVREY